MSGLDTRKKSLWLVFAIAALAGCGATKEESVVGTNQEAIRTTTDYGDAVATATIDEATHTIVATLEDPDQTGTLLTLEWNIEDGTAIWYTPGSSETNAIPAEDLRLSVTPTLEGANQMVYEEWQLGDDAYNSFCTDWRTVCFPMERCYTEPYCDEHCDVTPDGASCYQQCDARIVCDWDYWCYWECFNWGLLA